MGSPSRGTEYDLHTEALARPGLLPSRDQWRALGVTLLDLVFPPRCAGCGRVDTDWCRRCDTSVRDEPLMASVPQLEPLDGMAATAAHAGHLQDAVHALKYQRVESVVPALAGRLAAQYAATGWTVDAIAPVPLHASRTSSRGYNQAERLAAALSGRVGLPCFPDALLRERNTRSQVGLSRAERQANVAGAFIGVPDLLHDRSLLLVDDVYTTGATLRACARAALDAGATHVYGLTVTVAE